MKLKEAVAKRLNELLKEKGISKKEFSRRCGISYAVILNIASAKKNNVSTNEIWAISRAMDIKMKEFLCSPLFDRKNIDLSK